MSWFGKNSGANPASTISTVEFDNKIVEATSESIPNGDIELSISFEITDIIRSKKIAPKQAMRSLKKRLTLIYLNPNLVTSCLKLIDLCIKNSGLPFLIELDSKEFFDYLIDFIFKIHYNVKEVKHEESKMKVGDLILMYLSTWKTIFESANEPSSLNYLSKKYHELENEGYRFPESNESGELNSRFIADAEIPPDWVDNEECMICYTPFSMINRKHHCRACGGVFCQTHSSNNIPLVNLGIMEPVRVCDNCYAKYNKNKSKAGNQGHHSRSRAVREDDDVPDEDEDFKKAIELSLRESGTYPPPESFEPPSRPPPQSSQPSNDNADDEDDEMKAAIAASLREYESEKSRQSQYTQPPPPQQQQQYQDNVPSQPESDLYNISFPISSSSNTGNYQQPQFTAPQQQNFPPQQQQQQQPFQRPPQPQQPPQEENLSQADEEQINFIKNDPKKQQNIMYDENLNELYGKIIKLKPKLNKSLRNSIEKYEIFLTLNNQISSITRLYDMFLEQKLNMAYGNLNVNNGYPTQPQYVGQQVTGSQQQQQPQFVGAQTTGSQPQYPQVTGPQQGNYYNQQVTGQNTGYQNYPPQSGTSPVDNRNSYVGQQPTGSSEQQQQPFQNYQPTGQEQQQQRPFQNYQPTGQLQPSEPDFGDDDEEEEPQRPQSNQPSYPVYPTNDDALPETPGSTSDTDKNYISVSLPHYPPPEDLSNELPPSQHFIRATSNIDPNAYEKASAKYPTLENVEENYNQNKGLEDLPNMPKLQQFEGEQQQEERPNKSLQKRKSFVAEPEPLIEL
ncbi:VPS27 Vacuolar protein sorting-associated protein 27 [Candida maltosa Xu316]